MVMSRGRSREVRWLQRTSIAAVELSAKLQKAVLLLHVRT
jgi:hypothetical protein